MKVRNSWKSRKICTSNFKKKNSRQKRANMDYMHADYYKNNELCFSFQGSFKTSWV